MPKLIACLLLVLIPAVAAAQAESGWHLGDIDRLRDAGKIDSALLVGDSLLARDSSRVEVLLRRAAIFQSRGDTAEQWNDLRRAFRVAPASREVNRQLAGLFAAKRIFDSAAFHSGIALGPVNSADKPSILTHAEYLESSGAVDSAARLLGAVWRRGMSKSLGSLPPPVGWKPTLAEFTAIDGRREIWNQGRPAIFLFWATWSERSLRAMTDLLEALPKSGVSWQFFPVNADRIRPRWSDSTLFKRARELKYGGPVWVDSGLGLMHEWGIDRLPTVVFTGIGGAVVSVATEWSDATRDRVLKEQMGGYADTVDALPAPPDTARQRAQNLLGSARRAWQMGDRSLALQQVSRALRADPANPDAQLHTVLWRWQNGDSSGARYGIQTVLKQDSSLVAALGLRGMMCWWQGRDSEAVALMSHALALDSNFLPAWRIVGWDAANRGEQIGVDQALSRIRALNRNDWAVSVIEAVRAAADNPQKSLATWRELVQSQ